MKTKLFYNSTFRFEEDAAINEACENITHKINEFVNSNNTKILGISFHIASLGKTESEYSFCGMYAILSYM